MPETGNNPGLDGPNPRLDADTPAAKQDVADIGTGRRRWPPRAALRMAAIVFAAVLAALLLDTVVRSTLPRFPAEAEQATRRAADWVRPAAVQQRRAIDDARQVLRSIAGLSSLFNAEPARCAAFFARQAERHPNYANLGIIRPDGQVLCSAQPLALSAAQGEGLSEETRRGGLGLLPDPGKGTLLIAVPLRDKAGSPAASLAFAAVALPGLDGRPVEAGDAGALNVELFTGAGLILARHPDEERLAGSTLSGVPLIGRAAQLGSGSGEGSGELAGPDGVSRYYAFLPVDGPGAQRRYLAAGLPVAAVHADTRHLLYAQLAGLVLLVAVLAVLAGIGGDGFLPKRLVALAGPSRWTSPRRAFRHGQAQRLAGWLVAAAEPLRRHLARLGLTPGVGNPGRDELKQTIESLQRSADEMAKLNDMIHLLQTCVGIAELHGVVARFAQELFPGDRGALYMVSESRNLVETAVAWDGPSSKAEVFTPDDCWAMRLGKTHGSADPHAEPQCAHVAEFPPGGYLCVPMIVRGEVLGILHLQHEGPVLEEGEDGARRRLAQTFAERTALALSNIQLTESLRAQSVRDPLTGLHNRRFLDEAMEIETHRAKRSHMPIGILMIDIDHFKRFNDSFGHAAGDALLRELGAFLHEQVREEDIPCRYGGEEFIVILPGATLEASRERAEALRSGVAGLRFDYLGKQLGPVTLSLGVACHPPDGPSWQQTVRAADAALYRAKAEGRNRVAVEE